jgi:ABC-type multidrug transport system fused ATPase/permease subunit
MLASMLARRPLLRCFLLYAEVPWLFASGTLALLLVNLAQPAVQWLIGAALHEIETGSIFIKASDGTVNLDRAWWWAGVLVGVGLARAVGQYLATVLGMAMGQALLHRMRARIFAQVQALDLGWHRRHGAGEVISRATRDSDLVRDALTGGWRTLIELAAIVVGTIGLLAWYHPALAVMPFVLVVAACVLVLRSAGRLTALNRRVDHAYDGMLQDLSEGVQGVRVIKTFALEQVRVGRFATRIGALAGVSARVAAYSARAMPLPQLVVSAGHVWVLAIGAWLCAEHRLSVGELIAAMLAMQALVFRVEAIGRLVQMGADARSSAKRIADLLDAVPAVAAGTAELPAGSLEVVLEHLVVAPVVCDVSLVLPAGSVTALVGATGSGKSTIAELLPRLRDPDAGRVLVGGVDLRQCQPAALRRRVQVVFQEGFLFSDSVRGNLTIGDPTLADAELWRVLEICAAAEFVRALPGGLDAQLGERGVTLSGGQRQRLCLARAVLAHPAVLVGDDATSALDAATESQVLTRLRAALPGTTILLIAAKRSTLAHVDRIAVLANGRITAVGSRAGMDADPAFRELLGLDP